MFNIFYLAIIKTYDEPRIQFLNFSTKWYTYTYWYIVLKKVKSEKKHIIIKLQHIDQNQKRLNLYK